MVPALYDDGEKEALASGCHDEVIAAGLDDSRDGLWRYFVDKCRANLHVVLAMSPVGEALRTRCRNFPGMVNNTVIDWFEPWPEQVRFWLVWFDCVGWSRRHLERQDHRAAGSLALSPLIAHTQPQALESVATVFLAQEDLPAPLRTGIVQHMVGVHQSVRSFSARFEQQLRRHNYVTVSFALKGC